MSRVSIQLVKIFFMPSTTFGFSVIRSSRPEKSPYSLDSPLNVESPRLW
jgi:hypothetical protein